MDKLYMFLTGCTLKERNIEQHDVFFTIATHPSAAVPALKRFWPEAGSSLHIDAWRELRFVDGYKIKVESRDANAANPLQKKLFFLNLGGYQPGEFEEFHYKMLCVAKDKGDAMYKSRQSAFYKHRRFDGAPSHIDDRFGIDVDDLFDIQDLLTSDIKHRYAIRLLPAVEPGHDDIHLGYFRLDKM